MGKKQRKKNQKIFRESEFNDEFRMLNRNNLLENNSNKFKNELKKQGIIDQNDSEKETVEKELPMVKTDIHDQPRVQKVKAGRWWKEEQTERASSRITNARKRNRSTSWKDKQSDKLKRQLMKEKEQELIDQRIERKRLEREKRIEKKRRKLQNQMKSQKYTTIKNVEKIKKMNKKQLKMIRKTSIDHNGDLVYVPLYQ